MLLPSEVICKLVALLPEDVLDHISLCLGI